MAPPDFESTCPKCGKAVFIPADRLIQRARCGGCGVVYGILKRLRGELDLVPIRSREHAGIRERWAQIEGFKKWVVVLVVALIVALCLCVPFVLLPRQDAAAAVPMVMFGLMIAMIVLARQERGRPRRKRRRKSSLRRT